MTSMISRRTFAAAVASAALAIAAFGPASAGEAPKEVRIGYQKASVSIVARQSGQIEKRLKELGVENVKWVEFQFGPPMLEAIGAGAVDVGAVGDTPPVFAQAAGANVVYAAVSPASQHAILVRADSPVKSVADLKGKKVGIPKGSSAHNLVVQALAANGLAFSDIQPVYLTPADGVAAFARGSIDAFAVWDPFYALVELRQNGRPVAGLENLPPTNAFYLANGDFAKKHPEALQALLDEIRKITEWAGQNRDAVAEASQKATGIDPEGNRRAINRAEYSLRPLTGTEISNQQKVADAFYALGLIPRQITVRDIVWTPPQQRAAR
ncbi:aliphatic sulfonate ABC transporter substrate-binding protein [Camelimonas abortus]|uniref:Aliphatic sulfonate ABC transporter substrate-binding protein n=1 Tax=Camelimonas abortus TaxID=1017184 RepID=A0ABV7LE03_9HYPH